ncbi:helix-turn-helix domain-containing protein [Streptomyces sp. NPDC058382]|uniref:helix-turn-helix domain-containing protein n=1 Tax=unclassified Streptomyces TaxID=2593676 RepID=UPI003630658A
MLTLNRLIETRPDLRLRWIHPAQASAYGEIRVAEVTALVPAEQTGHDIKSHHLPATGGGLALVAWGHSQRARDVRALCELITDLSLRNAAGLVLRTPANSVAKTPQAQDQAQAQAQAQARADELKFPLLTTGADSEWVGVNHFIQQQRAVLAERHVEQLENLLNRIPARVNHSRTATDIVTWLSSALHADVALGSSERGILAADPGGRTNLARHLATSAGASGSAPAEHTHAVRVFGGGDTLVLGVASHRALTGTEVRLVRHAAKLLGFSEQARSEHQAVILGPRCVNQAATQLLIGLETAKAQIITHTLAPSLADTEKARVRIVDTGGHDREATLRWCEDELEDRALVSPCPENATQIVVVTSARHDPSVGADLQALVGGRGWIVMGVSRFYDVEAIGPAHAEAAKALRNASRLPGRISTGVHPKLAPLLPRLSAHAWATNLLEPVLRQPKHRQILDTVRIGCSFKAAEASRALGIHRNTLRQRLARANSVLGLDLHTGNDRILVLLALDILSLPTPQAAAPVPVPSLDDLLAYEIEAVRSWAESRLSPLLSDQRDLENTLCVWLENDLSVKRTSKALGVSEVTVRHHINDVIVRLKIDVEKDPTNFYDTSMVTIADVGIATHVLLGRPQLRQPETHSARNTFKLPADCNVNVRMHSMPRANTAAF